jgi:hypothetical protein
MGYAKLAKLTRGERAPQEMSKSNHNSVEKTLWGMEYELDLELVANHSIVYHSTKRTEEKEHCKHGTEYYKMDYMSIFSFFYTYLCSFLQ